MDDVLDMVILRRTMQPGASQMQKRNYRAERAPAATFLPAPGEMRSLHMWAALVSFQVGA
jgi:hypothetical protein